MAERRPREDETADRDASTHTDANALNSATGEPSETVTGVRNRGDHMAGRASFYHSMYDRRAGVTGRR
jgi:hypothetical protein